jgi:type I restriction enzyme S subunit
MVSLQPIDNVDTWIEGIPAGWKRVQLKHVAIKLARPVHPEDEIVICTNKGTVVPRGEKSTGLISLTGDGYQGVMPGDLLIHGMDTWHGAIAVSNIKGQCTSVVHVCDSTQSKRFLAYFLRALAFRNVYKAFSNGVRQNTSDFRSWKKAGEIPIVIPSLEKQHRIADYLDAKCEEIDHAIEAAEKSIDEYKAYKDSIICRAVTKGLDTDAPMKNSGVDWLDEVPRHWDIVPSKTVFIESKEKRHKDDERLTPSQNFGVLPQSEYMKKVNAKVVLADKGFDNWKHVEPYDFIISLRSFQGGLEMSRITGCVTWHYIVLRSIREIDFEYFRFLFKSRRYIEGIQSTCQYLRDGQDLRYSNFIQVPLPLPPLDEQRDIANFLGEKCEAINRAIDVKRAIVTDLKLYKQSLIFEAVTGKREV